MLASEKGYELGHPGSAQSRSAAPPHQEEPADCFFSFFLRWYKMYGFKHEKVNSEILLNW